MKLAFSIVLLCLFARVATPQANQGALSGLVTDPSGAVVFGAQIRVTNITARFQAPMANIQNAQAGRILGALDPHIVQLGAELLF